MPQKLPVTHVTGQLLRIEFKQSFFQKLVTKIGNKKLGNTKKYVTKKCYRKLLQPNLRMPLSEQIFRKLVTKVGNKRHGNITFVTKKCYQKMLPKNDIREL